MILTFLANSPVIAGVVGLLVLFSITSWTIFLGKGWQLARSKAASARFLDVFWKAEGEERRTRLAHQTGPLSVVWQEFQHELARTPSNPKPPRFFDQPTAEERHIRYLRAVAEDQANRLEKGLPFLATTASTTPFIGLFGTVWGIMDAFGQIAQAESSALSVVAPGISEALVTTALGLAVAIPAVVAYNALLQEARRQATEIDRFVDDVLPLVRRHFDAS